MSNSLFAPAIYLPVLLMHVPATGTPQAHWLIELAPVTREDQDSGEAEGRAYGTLYMKGQTSEAVMDITFNGGLFNPLEGRNAMGFSARMELDRRSHGIGSLPETILGHTVRIRIEAEFLEGGEAE